MTKRPLWLAVALGLSLGAILAVLIISLRLTAPDGSAPTASPAFTPDMVDTELVDDDGDAVQVFIVVPATAFERGEIVEECVLSYLSAYDSATCYFYGSEEALTASGLATEFGGGFKRSCWVAFASGSLTQAPVVTDENPDRDEACP